MKFSNGINLSIIKQDTLIDINEQIVHDADVLEIMRLTGRKGFQPVHLKFGNDFAALAELRASTCKADMLPMLSIEAQRLIRTKLVKVL